MASLPATDKSVSFPSGSRLAGYLALAYLVLIVYASLIPFSGWRVPGVEVWSFLFAPWSRHIRPFDLFINFLAYLPLGFLLVLALHSQLSMKGALVFSALSGFALSLAMEAVQMYLPSRTSSGLDVLTNGLGASAGAFFASRRDVRNLITDHLADFRDRWFVPGSVGDMGLVLLGLWYVSQLDPSLPLLGTIFFANSGGPNTHDFSLLGMLSAMCNTVAIGLLFELLTRTAKAAFIALLVLLLTASVIKLLTAAVLLKPQALLQWLAAESVIGIGYGLVVVAASLLLTLRRVILLCALALAVGIVVSHLRPNNAQSALTLFSWHYGHLLNFTGLARVIAELWPFAALGYLGLFFPKLRTQIRHRV
ncbi:MAG TPA: VanZ family protein [Burkholderiales bacterium]|nr:VanZ family protein [Burkholderiales bacterium]